MLMLKNIISNDSFGIQKPGCQVGVGDYFTGVNKG